ncbi:hypothetical protein ACWGF2_39715 [Streptomyces sp. NPDC054919]
MEVSDAKAQCLGESPESPRVAEAEADFNQAVRQGPELEEACRRAYARVLIEGPLSVADSAQDAVDALHLWMQMMVLRGLRGENPNPFNLSLPVDVQCGADAEIKILRFQTAARNALDDPRGALRES